MALDVMLAADYEVLVLIAVCSGLLLLTFLIGITRAILKSRPILAVCAFLLWLTLASILAIGYVTYKRSSFALDRKPNLAWSQWYMTLDRLVVQNTLHCCEFYNLMHEVTFSRTCCISANLPGCKAINYGCLRI